DTTLDRDQTIKKEIYADAGIPTYWIVNLQDRQIEVYTKPLASRDYGERRTYQFDQQVPVVIDGKTIGELKLADHLAA
ncbi:MAG: Uma2 family endonuclease, partial [Chloroflexota bacterium]